MFVTAAPTATAAEAAADQALAELEAADSELREKLSATQTHATTAQAEAE